MTELFNKIKTICLNKANKTFHHSISKIISKNLYSTLTQFAHSGASLEIPFNQLELLLHNLLSFPFTSKFFSILLWSVDEESSRFESR